MSRVNRGKYKIFVEFMGWTGERQLKLCVVRLGGEGEILWVAGKWIDFRRKTSGEGGVLENN